MTSRHGTTDRPVAGARHRGPARHGVARPRSARARVTLAGLVIALVVCAAGIGAGVPASLDGGPAAAVSRAWRTATGHAGTRGSEPDTQVSASNETAAARGADVASRSAAPERTDLLPWSIVRGWQVPLTDLADPSGLLDETVVADTVVPQLVPPELPGLADGLLLSDISAGLASLEFPEAASGTLVVVAGSQPAPGPGPVRTVRVEVEAGLPIDTGLFALTVMTTLNDPRGWGADGAMSFARTDGDADLRVVLASPQLVDALCAPLETVGKLSCGTRGQAVLNARRWILGAGGWDGDKVAYRQYLVNHEVGHLLGHRHEPCAGPGRRAVVMQQQSGTIAGCLANPWPSPSP